MKKILILILGMILLINFAYAESCAPESFTCYDSSRMQCNLNGTGYNIIQKCDYGCNEAGRFCNNPPSCILGAMRCAGDTAPIHSQNIGIEKCIRDINGNNIWSIQGICVNECMNFGECYNGFCTPGRLACGVNNIREQCNSLGAWDILEACEYGCIDGECIPQDIYCEPGDNVRCTGNIREMCTSNRTYVAVGECVYGCDENSQCIKNSNVPICSPNEFLCDDNNKMQCSFDGLELNLLEICEYGCIDGECNSPIIPLEKSWISKYWIIPLLLLIIIIGGLYYYFEERKKK